MTIFGMMRVKNEAKWIIEVVTAILPICERVFILDDNSTDDTPILLDRFNERVTLFRSPFTGLDESRDKEFLLDRIYGCIGDMWSSGDEKSPFWALAIDGDEVLVPEGQLAIHSTLLSSRKIHAYKLPIHYLWNDRQHRRVDGVYRHFARPSIFRLMNKAFRFQRTPWGGNFHCSSIPQELLHHSNHPDAIISGAPLLHLGYMDKAQRLKKYEWYNKMDPNNPHEDCYRHIVQGDVPEVPADAKLKWAGPLEIVPV
jgi:glycosyltransferase involved in cell wall biosynthesis